MKKETLKRLEGLLIRGKYMTVVGGAKPDPTTVVREGVALDEIKGFVDTVKDTKTGNTILVMRNMNRITAGSRAEITDADLIRAELDHRVYKGLPGEYKYRSYRAEGLHSLEVCKGGKWEPVTDPAPWCPSFEGPEHGQWIE